jgi:hypothetical protein
VFRVDERITQDLRSVAYTIVICLRDQVETRAYDVKTLKVDAVPPDVHP